MLKNTGGKERQINKRNYQAKREQNKQEDVVSYFLLFYRKLDAKILQMHTAYFIVFIKRPRGHDSLGHAGERLGMDKS